MLVTRRQPVVGAPIAVLAVVPVVGVLVVLAVLAVLAVLEVVRPRYAGLRYVQCQRSVWLGWDSCYWYTVAVWVYVYSKDVHLQMDRDNWTGMAGITHSRMPVLHAGAARR